MRRRLTMLVLLTAISCRKDPPVGTNAPPVAPPKSEPVAVASASAAPAQSAAVGLPEGPTSPVARPRYLRRARPDATVASSSYDDKKTKERHPPGDAFDGDRTTSWVEGAATDGTGEWIEATFKTPQRVYGLYVDTGIVSARPGNDPFPLNAHAKRLRLVLDGADAFAKDVGPDVRAVAWLGIDRSIGALRIVADAVHPGSKWTDFGITEIAVLVDAASAPSVPLAIVEQEVAAVGTPDEAAKLLLRFGIVPPKSALEGATVKASIAKAALVDGEEKERLVRVSLTSGEEGSKTEWSATAILGTVQSDRLVVLGTDVVQHKSVTNDDVVAVALEKVHSAQVDDVVVRWNAGSGREAVRVYALERGFVERLVDVVAEGEIALSGDAPRPVKTTKGTLTFDAAAFAYH